MSLSIPPAFAQAEIEYRQQRIKAEFPARGPAAARRGAARASRPNRLAALFRPWRRRPERTLGAAPSGARQPMPAPHHLASG